MIFCERPEPEQRQGLPWPRDGPPGEAHARQVRLLLLQRESSPRAHQTFPQKAEASGYHCMLLLGRPCFTHALQHLSFEEPGLQDAPLQQGRTRQRPPAFNSYSISKLGPQDIAQAFLLSTKKLDCKMESLLMTQQMFPAPPVLCFLRQRCRARLQICHHPSHRQGPLQQQTRAQGPPPGCWAGLASLPPAAMAALRPFQSVLSTLLHIKLFSCGKGCVGGYSVTSAMPQRLPPTSHSISQLFQCPSM